MRHVFSFALLTTLACASPAMAQGASDVVIRLEQIEAQMRELTGQVEQLQYRNQQLEQQLRALQGGGGAPAPQAQVQPMQPAPQPGMAPRGNMPVASAAPITNDPSPIRPIPGGQRGDAFDPNADPNAPGAPRQLGALPAGQPSAPEANVRGAPGQPMDISGNRGGGDPNALAAVAPPGNSPRDQYDLGAGAIQRKDYPLAEQAFREFLRRYPNDHLVADAQFWLGESQFQRKMYREAADAFLTVSTKHETAAKAPDSLLRLGQSLAALGEKESACATFAEVGRRYPRAAPNVRQGVEREQKRTRC
jgi:tol-pal system protein YbgF